MTRRDSDPPLDTERDDDPTGQIEVARTSLKDAGARFRQMGADAEQLDRHLRKPPSYSKLRTISLTPAEPKAGTGS